MPLSSIVLVLNALVFAVELALLLFDSNNDRYIPSGQVVATKLITSPHGERFLRSRRHSHDDPSVISPDILLRFKCPSASNFKAFFASMESPLDLRYAIVIDAGSQGSRVHVYEFVYCQGHLVGLASELFHESTPGLSKFASNGASFAWRTVEPILESARVVIPPEKWSRVPLRMCATAGMRLVGSDNDRRMLLTTVQKYLVEHSGFSVSSDAVQVISGAEEAVMAWLTVNFLRNLISFDQLIHHHHHTRGRVDARLTEPNETDPPLLDLLASRTSTTLDLGGASTQIVFASNGSFGKSIHHQKYYFPLETRHGTLQLYRHSHLGYGLIEARKRINVTCKPCSHSDFKWSDCVECINIVMFPKESNCLHPPCILGSTHQPPIHKNSPIVAASFLSETIRKLLNQENEEKEIEITLGEIEAKSKTHCIYTSPKTTLCMDLAYIVTLLKSGYGLEEEHRLVLTEEIGGFQMSWSLGVALGLLAEQHHDN